MSTQLSLLKLSLSWSSFTFSALLFVCFSKSIKVQPRLIFRIQKRLPFSHSEENDKYWGWLQFCSLRVKIWAPMPSAVLCISPWSTLIALPFSGKCSQDLNSQTRGSFLTRKGPESLGRLHLILGLIGEWRDATANPCLVAYQQKGLVSLFLPSLCLGISPLPLSIRKGIIPHSTCIRKK